MPYHIDLTVHSQIRIIFLFEVSFNFCLLCFFNHLLIYISDISVICSYLIPVFHFFNKPKLLTFLRRSKNGRFNSAAIAYAGIFLNRDCFYIFKFILYGNPVWIFCNICVKICIFLHIRKVQIHFSIFHPYLVSCLRRCTHRSQL